MLLQGAIAQLGVCVELHREGRGAGVALAEVQHSGELRYLAAVRRVRAKAVPAPLQVDKIHLLVHDLLQVRARVRVHLIDPALQPCEVRRLKRTCVARAVGAKVVAWATSVSGRTWGRHDDHTGRRLDDRSRTGGGLDGHVCVGGHTRLDSAAWSTDGGLLAQPYALRAWHHGKQAQDEFQPSGMWAHPDDRHEIAAEADGVIRLRLCKALSHYLLS
mmetsp:Transcript_54473/g.151820  ORF Transcript_54473/g.151820 Transcript_54473/m.151820 type:complete len:217 (+) Transcript_54473:653-1303(+)